jgi:hypothetical protein
MLNLCIPFYDVFFQGGGLRFTCKFMFSQIVSGVLYHLLLRVGTTSCSENGASKPGCVEHHSSPIKICKVELHRTFTDNSHLDAKVSII